MEQVCVRGLVLWSLLACLAWLSVGLAGADGRVFLLELRNGSDIGFHAASRACEDQGARMASAMELRHAVVECAFSACARGWLTGPSIGTTVCRSVSGSLRAVDMQVENATEMYERLAVFCVKDTGAPCGNAPIFPNTHLQGHTGLELGDELLYACNPGYVLPNGETAFSLLCDSCGEWYGLVQLCAKDKDEAFIDYEDKLPVDHHLYDGLDEVHHMRMTTRPTDHGEEEESTPEPDHLDPVMVVEAGDRIEKNSAVSVTEPPVSQLSQKHMFWFPSEAFQEEEHNFMTTGTPVEVHTQDEDYISAKTGEEMSEITTEDNDSGHTSQRPTEKPASRGVGSTVESWLDGYPIAQEEERVGGGSTGETAETVPGQAVDMGRGKDTIEVEDIKSVTDAPEEAGLGGGVHSHLEEASEGVSEVPEEQEISTVTNCEDLARKNITESSGEKSYGEVIYNQEEGPDSVTDSTQSEVSDVVSVISEERHYVTQTPVLKEIEGGAKGPVELEHEKVDNGLKDGQFHGGANDVELSHHSQTQITSGVDETTLKNTPSTSPENVSTSQGGMEFKRTATPSGMATTETTPSSPVHVIRDVATPTVSVSRDSGDFGHFVDQNPTVDDRTVVETHENQSVMEGDVNHSLDQPEDDGSCTVRPCHMAGHGPTLAAIIVAIVAAIVGVALGAWCYKRRQQKTSHYQLNGTNRQTQCIELQQTV
ncbi:sushi domain-containing protein 5 [Clarias gariepinus]|uniref:sushi domain-containing protein 5 n=1 Tax=Clarias gariepinus TaxID=13013 RepID=UPI00234D49A5|nr:sushi domain-containing protein 5 [Clarias gariepinus]